MANSALDYLDNLLGKKKENENEKPPASAGGSSALEYLDGLIENRNKQTTPEAPKYSGRIYPASEIIPQPKVNLEPNEYTTRVGYTDTGSRNYSREDILRMLADAKVAQEQERALREKEAEEDAFRRGFGDAMLQGAGLPTTAAGSSPDMNVVKKGNIEAYTDAGTRKTSREDRLREQGVRDIVRENEAQPERTAYRYENMPSSQLRAEWQEKNDDAAIINELLGGNGQIVPLWVNESNFDSVFKPGNYNTEQIENARDIISKRKYIANKYNAQIVDDGEKYRDALNRVLDRIGGGNIAYRDANGNAVTYANLFYENENKEKATAVRKDKKYAPIYAEAEQLDKDIAFLDSVTNAPADAYQYNEGLADIEKRYGVTLRNNPTAATNSNLLADRNALDELWLRLNDKRDEDAAKLKEGGYDYGRMSEYTRRLADRERLAEDRARYEKMAEEHPVLATLANLFSGFGQLVEGIDALVSGKGSATPGGAGSYVPMNTARSNTKAFSESVNSTVSKKIEEDILDLTGSDTLAWLVSRGYSGVTSVATSLITMGTTAAMFGPAGEAIGLSLLGSGAGMNAMVDAAERGANNADAIFYGLAAGINEALFEKLSFDRFVKIKGSWNRNEIAKSIANWLWQSAKQGGVEASEEVFTDIANRIADNIINDKTSEYETDVARYKKQGLTTSEAQERAKLDFLEQVVESAYGGFIGGGASAATKSFTNIIRERAQELRNIAPAKRAAKGNDIAKKIASGKELTTEEAKLVIADPKTSFAVQETTGIDFSGLAIKNGVYTNAYTPEQVKSILTDWYDNAVDGRTTRVESPAQPMPRISLNNSIEQNLTALAQTPTAAETSEISAISPAENTSEGNFTSAGINARNAEITSDKQGSWNKIADSFGENGRKAMRAAYDGSLNEGELGDLAAAFAKYYEVGRNESSLLDVPARISATVVDAFGDPNEASAFIQSAVQAGAADRALTISAESDTIESQEIEGGTTYDGQESGVRVRGGSIRGDVQSTRGQTHEVRGEQAQNQGGRTGDVGRGTSGEIGQNVRSVQERAVGEKVSPKQLGIRSGSDASNVVMKAGDYAIREAAKLGIDVTAVKGALRMKDGVVDGVSYRDSRTGRRGIVYQGDSKLWSEKQFMRHEGMHIRIAQGKVSMNAISDAIKRLDKTDADVRTLFDAYLAKYGDIYDDSVILEEIFCDAYAAMDRFGIEGARKAMDAIRREFGKAYEASRSTESETTVPDIAERERFSISPPFAEGTTKNAEFVESLSPEARKTYDIFHDVYNAALIRSGGKKTNIAAKFLTAQEWNEKLAADPAWAERAKNIASILPDGVRDEMHMHKDGTIEYTPLEKEFKMAKSLEQRLVDALPYEKIDAEYQLGDKTIKLPTIAARQSVGGEAYRRALLKATRDAYFAGDLRQVSVGTMSKDKWGSVGFLAKNTKTGASGDFTTLCPQMMYNRGCWYCYRRAAMESGVNNKLVAEKIYYTGEILRLKDEDVAALNKNGGLRIQSFGDWMPYFSAQLADVLYDAQLRKLQVKIITKEPSMISYVAALREQGIGLNLYFNLSADYTVERAPAKAGNTDVNSLDQINPERPFMRDDNGEMWWKRAMAVEEAAKIREKYPWVNVRIVASDQAEFIRGLKDPNVQVVTGYHGKIRDYERIDSATGESKVIVEPLGDSGMPTFSFRNGEWSIEDAGRTKAHRALAQRIAAEGLEQDYYNKTCCITGRCATCEGKCGKVADSFYTKNATNDAESTAWWAENMTKIEWETARTTNVDMSNESIQSAIDNAAEARYSRRDYFDDEDIDLESWPLTQTLKTTIEEINKYYNPQHFQDLFEAFPKYDYATRIQNGGVDAENAIEELKIKVGEINDVQLLEDLRYYPINAHPSERQKVTVNKKIYGQTISYDTIRYASYEQTHRKGVKTYRDIIDARIAQLKDEGQTSFGVTNKTVWSVAEAKAAFNRINDDPSIAALADAVFKAASKLRLKIKFAKTSSQGSDGFYLGNANADMYYKGLVTYNTEVFNSKGESDRYKASLIVHELLHACTAYALDSVELPAVKARVGWRLDAGVRRAAEKIIALYKAAPVAMAMSDELNARKNVLEFVAEVTDDTVRNKLAAITTQEFLIGLAGENALEQLEDGVKYMLEHLDLDTYDAYADNKFYSYEFYSYGDRYSRLTDEMAEIRRRMAEMTDGFKLTERELLTNALETVSDERELAYLESYRNKINRINAWEAEAKQLRRDMMSGNLDAAEYKKAQVKANHLEALVRDADSNIIKRVNASKPIQNLLKREQKKAFKEGREAQRLKEKEREAENILRDRIKKIAKDFNERLQRPTERRWVPRDLIEEAAAVAEMIDPTGAREGTKVKAKHESMKAALLSLKEAYGNLAKSPDPDFKSEFRAEFSSMVGELATIIGNTPVRDMSFEQLEDVYAILNDIRSMLSSATKQIGTDNAADNYDLGTKLMAEQAEIGSLGLTTGKVNSVFRNVFTNPMRAVYEMSGHKADSVLNKQMKALEDGWVKAEEFRMTEQKKIDALRADKNDLKKFNDAVEKPYDFGLTTVDGKPLKISKMQAMQILLTYERETSNANRRHLENYIEIPDPEKLAKGKVREALDKPQIMPALTAFDVNKIVEGMDEWDKRFLNVAREVFRVDAANAINEVTVQTRHRPVATEKAYIPYELDKNLITKENENVTYNAALDNAGILKSMTPNANQSLIIRGLNYLLQRHIDDVAKIYGLSIPIRNFNKVLNVKEIGGARSVRSALSDNWGARGTNLIDQAIADVQASRKVNDVVEAMLGSVKGAMVVGSLVGNLRVWLRQAASYPTAASVISHRALTKGIAKYAAKIKDGIHAKDVWDEIDKITPLHYMRRSGLSDQELGEFMQSKGWKNRVNSKLGKMSPMKWIQAMDVGTTAALFYACKEELKSRGVTESDENYKTEMRKLYNQVLTETQPMYDPLHRVEMSKGPISSKFFVFQTQPMQNSGILREGALEFRSARKRYGKGSKEAKAAGRKFARAATSQFVSHLVFTAMGFIANAMLHRVNPYRDDDEGKVTPESIFSALGLDLAKNYFNAVLPFVGNVASQAIDNFINGTNYALISDATVDKIVSTGEAILNAFSKPSWDSVKKLGLDLSTYFGVPGNNLKNLYEAVKYHTQDIINGEFGSFEAGYERTSKQTYNRLYNAWKGGSDKYKLYYDDAIESGKSEQQIKQAMDDRIKQDKGVDSVTDLKPSDRYLSPSQQKTYDAVTRRVKSSEVWAESDASNRAKLSEIAYDVIAGYKRNTWQSESITTENDLTQTEYILYKLALDIVDKPDKNGKYGSETHQYTDTEKELAVKKAKQG